MFFMQLFPLIDAKHDKVIIVGFKDDVRTRPQTKFKVGVIVTVCVGNGDGKMGSIHFQQHHVAQSQGVNG